MTLILVSNKIKFSALIPLHVKTINYLSEKL